VAIKLAGMKELRIVPIRFERAQTGAPDIAFPDIDDRGYNAKVPEVNGLAESTEIRGPVMGLTKKQEVSIKMIRENIDTAAELFITSSDESAISIVSPNKGEKCSSGKYCVIKLKGGDFVECRPKPAKIEVRFGAVDGPIIFELTTYIFTPLPIFIQPHIVTIHDPAGSGGHAPTMNLNDVMKQVKALWACCGVQLHVQPEKSFAINLLTANKLAWSEINNVYTESWQANTINVYIMQELDSALGYGFSKDTFAGIKLSNGPPAVMMSHPAVFMGMNSGSSHRSNDTYWCANDLAHELGHFFTLWHPTDGPDNSWQTWRRNETWSMRFLMHNHNTTFRHNPPQGGSNWANCHDFGYGEKYRAGLISMKNIRTTAGAGRDGQCSVVRNHIAQGPGVLY